MSKLRESILELFLNYRDNRHLLTNAVRRFYNSRFIRMQGETDVDFYNRIRMTTISFEKELVQQVTEQDELDAYRNLLSFMELHINYTMNHDEIAKAIQLIGAWGRSLRAGNGEIPWWENERMRNGIIRKMGEIKNGK